MKRLVRYLNLGVLAVMAGSASAITVDGQWDDWFSYGGTSSENWGQSSASNSRLNADIRFQDDPEDDAVGVKGSDSEDENCDSENERNGDSENERDGDYENEHDSDQDHEASSAQDYDIEQIFYYYEDLDTSAYTGGTLYIGMVTGYDPRNTLYRAGDMFVDLGYAGGPATYDLAIATGTESNSRFGDVWSNNGWSTASVVLPEHASSNPYRVRDTQGGASSYTNAQVDWDYGVGSGDRHNFLEIGLNLDGSLEELIALGGIGFHWTMACGNDNINVFDSNPLTTIPPPPLNPVPEPATMVLFGMGAGLLAVRKRMSGSSN